MSAEKLVKWFKQNQMKGNIYKFHLIILILLTEDSNQIHIENSLIERSLCEKHLCVKFNHQLTFDKHFKSLCEKENARLKAFVRAVPYKS